VYAELEQVEVLDWRQFLIAVRRLADSFNYGTDRSPFLGSGVEYVQSRRYEFGDPVRSIDWRVTARTGRFFVKQFETPKQLPVYLLLDTSASMAVSSLARSKLATALQVAGGLALAALDRVSPVGLLTTGDDMKQYQPSLAKSQILQWLHELRRFRLDQTSQLARRLNDLNARLPSRSLLIALSDLHEPAALAGLKLAAQRHDVVVLQFRDPAERKVKGSGLIRGREPETGRELVIHQRSELVDQAAIEQQLKRAGIDHLLIDTDQKYAHRLRWFFRSRGGLGGKAR
jgi:uncharacterized protein (DUF58 family)